MSFRLLSWLALFSFVAIPFAGCNSATPPTIRATDFDQTCTQPSDCMIIDEGSQCCVACGNNAINKKDQAKYQMATQQRAMACRGAQCPALDCVARFPTCTNGKCAMCPTPDDCNSKDAGSDASTSDASNDASMSDASSDASKD